MTDSPRANLQTTTAMTDSPRLNDARPVAPSGLSVETLGMARVAGAGVGAADEGATGRAASVRGESVMALALWRFARGESVMAVGGGGSGAMIFL